MINRRIETPACDSPMAKSIYQLQEERERLCQQIAGHLDFLIGSVSTKGPKRPGFNLTFKLGGVTRTRHIRKQDLEKVRLMTARHKKLKLLIQKLSDLNWLILSSQTE
jgi:hypothetical protein